MRSEMEVNHAIEEYADMIRRVCFYHLKNRADCEDIFQEVFLKYMLYDGQFCDKGHERAWLLRVAINACKDYLKSFFRRNAVSLELINEMQAQIPEEHKEAAAKLRDILSIYAKNEDLISIGAYKAGTNPRLDDAIARIDRVNAFLMQKIDESFSKDESVKIMKEILR